VEKFGKARQTTDGSIIERMHISFWTTKATDTHSDLVHFHGNNDYANAPKCFVYTYIACLDFNVLNSRQNICFF